MAESSQRYLSPWFSDALRIAAELHSAQKRKKVTLEVAYVSHLMAVASLVLEDGGSEDEAIAGLFHDAMEDQGVTFEKLEADYGPEVARIVLACSDAVPKPGDSKAPYLQRKKAHIAHLTAMGADTAVLRVTAADKLHNCRDIVSDLHDPKVGLAQLDKFNGGRQGTCWYYGQMLSVLETGLPDSRLTRALRPGVEELHALAGLPFPAPEPSDDTVPRSEDGG